MRYNISYSNSKYDIELRQHYGNWVKSYSVDNFNSDWNYILGLSYRKTIKSYKNSISNVKKLYQYLIQFDSKIDGFVSSESNNSFDNLHHHLVINSKVDYDVLKNEINKFWGKIGVIDLNEYDTTGNYCYYMCKHLNKGDYNNLEILSKLEY